MFFIANHSDAILNEMLMFPRNRPTPSTVIIDGAALLLDDTLSVDRFWAAGTSTLAQLQHTATEAINTPPDAIDHALIVATNFTRHHKPLNEFGFTHQHGMSGALWHTGATYTLAIKGLPERVLAYCDLTDNEREAVTLEIQKLSSSGALIIAVAHAALSQPISSLGELHSHQLTFSGLISLANTIPGDIRELVRQARARGVSLRLLTGTHQQAAFAVASQLGIASHPSEIRDARHLHATPHTVQGGIVFARALPEHKAQIIKVLRETNSDSIVTTTKEELKAALAAKPPRS